MDAARPPTLSTRLENGGATVVVTGPMGLAEAEWLNAELVAARDQGATRGIRLDLTGATELNSSAIPAIVRAYKHARREGTDFAVTTRAESVRELGEITGLDCFEQHTGGDAA